MLAASFAVVPGPGQKPPAWGVFLGALARLRTQALVNDTRFRESMIPHHAIASMVSTRTTFKDPALHRVPYPPFFPNPETMKVLSPPAQGTLDYLLIIWLAMGPTALGFTGVTNFMCYLLAGLYLLVVLSTDFSLGLVRVLSYRALGGLEVGSALVFLGSPFLFGFAHDNPTARTFFMSFGAALLVLWALTDWSGKVRSEMNDDARDNLEGNRV